MIASTQTRVYQLYFTSDGVDARSEISWIADAFNRTIVKFVKASQTGRNLTQGSVWLVTIGVAC